MIKILKKILSTIFLVLAVLLCFSSGRATAQQTLAAIIPIDLPRYQQVHQEMLKILKSGGFGEDKLKIFTQTPNSDKMSLINSLRRAESAGVTLVVTYGSRATEVASAELKKTPLLFADVYDPVAIGAVKTLAAPGTDASGSSCMTDLALLVESLVALKPVQKVGVLYSKGEPGSEQQLVEIEKLAGKHGFSVAAENARNPQEASALAEKLGKSCDALFLTESLAVATKAESIATAVQSAKCLVFSQIPGLTAAGAVLGLEADLAEQGAIVAVHALQVLQGQKVHILPVRPAKKVGLLINGKAAMELGLVIPAELASKAKIL